MIVLLVAIALGTPAGALLIKALDPRLLSALVGAVAMLYVLAIAFRLTFKIPAAAGRRAGPVIGLLAGLMGGATGIATRGPMIIDSSGMATSGNPNPIAPLSIEAPQTITAAAASCGTP